MIPRHRAPAPLAEVCVDTPPRRRRCARGAVASERGSAPRRVVTTRAVVASLPARALATALAITLVIAGLVASPVSASPGAPIPAAPAIVAPGVAAPIDPAAIAASVAIAVADPVLLPVPVPVAAPAPAPAQDRDAAPAIASLDSSSRAAAVAALRAHGDAVGGAAAIAAADPLEIHGRLETMGTLARVRVLVRREPFAVREEHSALDGTPAYTWVTDLERAWGWPDAAATPPAEPVAPSAAAAAPARGLPLPFAHALPFLRRAMTWKLLLAPQALEGEAAHSGLPPFTQPPAPFLGDGFGEGRACATVIVRGPLGSSVNAWFDEDGGRWQGWQLESGGRMERLRAGRWRTFGALELPTVFLAFHDEGLHEAFFVDDVVDAVATGESAFAGDPETAAAGTIEILPLAVAPSDVPGSAYVLAGGVHLDGHGPHWALFDTASRHVMVHPGLVQALGLPRIATTAFDVLGGRVHAPQHWLAQLDLGPERRVQVPVVAQAWPRFSGLEGPRAPSLILGERAWIGRSPVLDLAGGRLLLRGAPAEPLAAIAGASVACVPLVPLEADGEARAIDVVVGGRAVPALVDTGSALVLRLSARALVRLGLPLGEAAWRARGARPYALYGADGVPLPDVLARLDEIRLVGTTSDGGALEIVYERPWVAISTAPSAADEPSAIDAVLGFGALLPFARMGFDGSRSLLELQPGDAVTQPAADAPASAAAVTRWIVAAPPDLPEPQRDDR